jgi:ATP-binding cassette subfamily B protein
MSIFRLYTRVLELLGKEARLGWLLAFANLLFAASQFAEPVLFGGIVDVLSGKPVAGSNSAWPFLLAWVAFGLFTIACSALVALQADRLSHRQRQAVLTSYFEHILQLPLTFHSGTHSGRLMKVMLNGTAVALSELAAGDPPVRALRRLHRADDLRRAQDLRHANGGRGAI